jgi:Icc-related predicted phosphoesterase
MDQQRSLRMLVGSDLHNDADGFNWFCALADAQQPELVVFLGDFVTGGPMGYIRETAATLRDLAPHAMAIPGNHDPRASLVELDIAAFDGFHNMHKKTAFVGGYSFAGLGGSILTPKLAGEFELPDEGFADPLQMLLPADVWVLHNPLSGILDELPNGVSLGSTSLLRAWKSQDPPPLLVLSGHVHAAVGTLEHGGTLFHNPGALQDGSASLVSLDGNTVTVEMFSRGAASAD